MNLINAFAELDKLYESVESETLKEAVVEETAEEVVDENSEDTVEVTEDSVEEPIEETSVEEPMNKSIVLECSKCGALVIKAESEVITDEESGMANIEEECAYCGEAAGFKAVGTFEAYDSTTEEEAETDEVEVEIEDDEAEEATSTEPVDESIFNRKSKDTKPASLADYLDKVNKAGQTLDKLQQDTLAKYGKAQNAEKITENKEEDLEELFDAGGVNVNLSLDGGQGNDVNVL